MLGFNSLPNINKIMISATIFKNYVNTITISEFKSEFSKIGFGLYFFELTKIEAELT